VTCVVNDKLLTTLLKLKDAGRQVSLVSLDTSYKGDESVELAGIRIFHVDPDKIDVEDPGEWESEPEE
jgi:hypothetical protein